MAGYLELFGRFGRNPQSCEVFLFFFEDQIDLAGKCHELLQVLLTRCHLCQLLQTLTVIRHPRKIIAAEGLPGAWMASQAWRVASMQEPKLRPTSTAFILTTMTLKSAALLALVGTMLMTVLLVWNFVLTFLNVLRDLVPAVSLFSAFIYAFGLSVMVFFFVFHRAQQ